MDLSSRLLLVGVAVHWLLVSSYKKLGADHYCNPKAKTEHSVFSDV